jgi:hypothetical protein
MRAMVVEVGLEIEQLVFQICRRPEQRAIQILAAKGADEPFHERMGQGNVGEGLDFYHLQYPQIGLPLVEPKPSLRGTNVAFAKSVAALTPRDSHISPAASEQGAEFFSPDGAMGPKRPAPMKTERWLKSQSGPEQMAPTAIDLFLPNS